MVLAGSNRKPALIAAARKISYSRADTSKLKEESWQERAWQVYDRLPAVFYMTRYRSDIASKVEYFVGTIDEAGMDPQVDEDGPAAKILDVEGGPELLRRLVSEMVVHWDVPGEGYLCRFDEAPFWRVLSTQELKKTGNDFTWGDATNSMGPIDADNVYRVWDPHPRFHWQADSPTRHIVEDAEELILLGREAKARSMSRLSAGILWLSDNTDLSPFAADEEGDEDAFARQLTQRMGAPLADPSSAASLVPWVISAHPDDISAARHMTFERDWDINLDLRRELLRSVATGLDLPPEILTGVADLNHWSAWLVSEMAVSQHVLPTVDAILDSLTTNWFKPLLEAGGVDPDGFVLWRDPSPATVPPDQSDVAVRLFELGGISGEAVRRVTNFDEDDAPTPEEIEQRIAKPAPNENPREPDGPPPRDGLEASISPDLISLVADEVERRFKEGGSPLAEAAVVAAVRRRVDAKALADIDRELLEWLVSQSQVEMDRLMVFASEAVTAATDPLDESLLARFRRQVEKKIAEAQAAARGWVESLTGRRTEFPDEEETRGRGVDIIIGGIIEAVRRRLFTPSAKPDPIDVGRIPDTLPPIDVLRRGMSVAGGGESLFEGQEFVDGIGNGQRIHDELEENGYRPELMVWRTGTPSHPFDPHQRLEGVEFDSWDSPKLAVTLDGQWISGSHYRPNDHKGCQCSVEKVLLQFLPAGEGQGVAVDAPQADIQSLDDLRTWADSRGLTLDVATRVTPENLPAIRQAVQAVDDMRARFGGVWASPRRPGLVEFDVGGPGVPGAAAFVKDRGAGRSFMSMTSFELDRYASAGQIGRTVAHTPYEAIVHEMGHVMTNSFLPNLKVSDPLSFMGIVRRNRNQVWKAGRSVDSKLIMDDLSQYAGEDDLGEFWGEAFTARNAASARARLSPAASARLDEFARLVNEEARQLYGLTEDVI